MPRLAHLILAVLFAAPAAAQDGPRFPAVTAENLESRRFVLPRELEGAYNIVVIAYERRQQADVDTWMPFLNALEKEDRRVRWYELPTIPKMTGVFIGWWIDSGMRRGIPDVSQRERTITLYLDKSEFRRALGLPDSDRSIHTLLIDREGRVLWRFDGRYDPAAAQSLRAKLAQLPRPRP